ncbi:MAG: transglycosylase SLT domain-containing protein [Candidatus Aenigmarchaeota archaeon]|nr:transglycosylase SLT domain-containing protein [Candidatus Aenigmarchaeota archaeon]
MGEIINEGRREFLRILPILVAGVPIITDSIDQDPPKPKIEIRKEPEMITKEAFTPMQVLVNVDPPKYDMDKVHTFFERNYPGSEYIIPMVFEACEKHSKTYHMDPLLVMSQIFQESEFDPAALSWVGAGGLMQFMTETAKDMGIENVYSPGYYKQVLKEHEQAKNILKRADLYKDLSVGEARMDMRAILRKRKKRVTELSKREVKEMEQKLYRHWSNLESLGEIVDLAGDEATKIVLDFYDMFENRLKDFQEGLLEMVTGRGFGKIEETYQEALYNFNSILDEFSVLEEYRELLSDKAKHGSRVMNRIFESAFKREEYEEKMREVRKGYERYIDEVRAGVFVNYRSGMSYWKGRFKLKKPSERSEFDGRFNERTNTDKGVKYDALLAKRFNGNMAYAMCAFNSGPDNVYLELQTNSGKKIYMLRIPFFRETVRYWDNIYNNFNQWYLSIV